MTKRRIKDCLEMASALLSIDDGHKWTETEYRFILGQANAIHSFLLENKSKLVTKEKDK